MSDLKSFIVLYNGKFIRAYEENAADKVIAEKDAAIGELKTEINKCQELLYDRTEYHSVLAMCAIYGCNDVREFHDTINAAIDRSDTQINHQKYKRCLAMAKICQLRGDRYERYLASLAYHDLPTIQRCRVLKNHYDKWYSRWLELAEKFKPNNSTGR